MKQQLNEVVAMQKIAGILNENPTSMIVIDTTLPWNPEIVKHPSGLVRLFTSAKEAQQVAGEYERAVVVRY